MIPKINNNPLENFQLNLPEETTTATLTKFYEEWGDSWEIGNQQVDNNGVIVSRSYSLLSFPYEEAKLVKIDLENYDPEWEGTFYYSIISYFKETGYSSHYKYNLPFNEWIKKETKFRQEAYYRHKIIEELRWERPKTIEIESGVIEYSYLPSDYKLVINVGKGLGAEIEVTDEVEIRIKESEFDNGEIVNKSFILLTKPYIEIKFKNIREDSHREIIIKLYGEYVYKTYVPANLFNQEESLTLVHAYNTEYKDRLKPPGLSNIPENFWNSNYKELSNIKLAERKSNAEWL